VPSATASSTSLDILRVLLVDESDRVRTTLRTILRTFGRYEVVAQASDILESFRAVLRDAPDVVIFDFDMPRGDEVDAILAIRALLPSALVVMVTDHPSVDLEALVIAAGADACIDKADTIHLPELLDDLLAGSAHPFG
jgi:DNA-binding NarL/FixJ family response regulator